MSCFSSSNRVAVFEVCTKKLKRPFARVQTMRDLLTACNMVHFDAEKSKLVGIAAWRELFITANVDDVIALLNTIQSVWARMTILKTISGAALLGGDTTKLKAFIDPQSAPPVVSAPVIKNRPQSRLRVFTNLQGVAKETDVESQQCLVCSVNQQTVLFLPCNHICCCIDCTLQLPRPVCVYCGQVVNGAINTIPVE